MVSFKAGDLVAVFGGEICENEKVLKNITVCDVLACGKHDLVVAPKDSAYRTGTYSVPKAACQKLSISKIENVTRRITKPEIGDLVLSYQKKSFSDETSVTNGILVSVTYKMGCAHMSTVMANGEMSEVPFDSLIVLEQNNV